MASLCRTCRIVMHAFYFMSENEEAHSPYRTVTFQTNQHAFSTEEGLAIWYHFSETIECALCSMMKAEVDPGMLDCGQALICFNASQFNLKGWIKSQLAFSLMVQVNYLDRDDNLTVVRYNPPSASLETSAISDHHADKPDVMRIEENSLRSINPKAIVTSTYLRPVENSRFKLAQNWIRVCNMNHSLCNTSTRSYCPARLIDVKNALLIETQGKSSSFRYAALTHCWGPNMPETGKTTTETLSSHMKHIEFPKLPRSFRDAMLIMEKLDIPYIWIDALCIIQDSIVDWETESAKMGLIYSHAWCTLAASGTTSCHDEIQISRNPFFGIIFEGGQDKRVQVSVARPAPEWQTFYNNNPLNTRGWTFQERELSPRILHFTANQMWWECRSRREQEDLTYKHDGVKEPATSIRGLFRTHSSLVDSKYVENAHKTLDNTVMKEFTSTRIKQVVQLRCLDSVLMATPLTGPTMLKNFIFTEARYNTWHKVIQDYSARKFTRITDRFPGLSGLVNEMKAAYGDEYVAGVWKGDLLRSLLWRRDLKSMPSTSELARRSSEYRAPSWSWAAIDDAISYDLIVVNRPQIDNTLPTTAHIEKFDLVPAGSDPNGRLESGSLLVCGRLKMYTSSDVSRHMTFHFDFSNEAEGVPIYLLCLFESLEFGSMGLTSWGWALVLIMIEGPVPVFSRIGVVSKVRSEWFDDAMTVKIPII